MDDEESGSNKGKEPLGSESLPSSVSSNEFSLSRSKKESSKSTDVLHIDVPLSRVSSIKDRINELELQVSSTSDKLTKSEVKSPTSQGRSGLVFNLANQFESGSKPSSPVDEGLIMKMPSEEIVEPIMSQTKPPVHKHHAILVKPSLWPEDSSSETENKTALPPSSSSAPTNKVKASSDSSSLHKKVQSDDSACDNTISLPLGEGSLSSFKTSHTLNSSAFKPFEASTNAPAKLLLDKKVNPYQSVNFTSSNERKVPENLPSASSLERNARHLCSNLKETNKTSVKRLKNCEISLPIIKPPTRNLYLGNSNQTDILNTKVNYFYDKEDIPFTPGRVMRTKQKIEEKNLTRTKSFDSGFPFQIYSMPSTPFESDIGTGTIIRRSHSLRNDNRTSVPFYGKWYPLPALASVTLPVINCNSQCAENKTMTHSVSTPSVVEAVNRVICGTQEVLTSAIHFMPSQKKVSSTRSSSDSDFEFGSASSLPDIESRDQTFIIKSPSHQSESPVPGIVKQQCELLENKATRTMSEKCSSDHCKLRRDVSKSLSSDQGTNLVVSDASKQDIKEHGIVKRLKKELEAKSGSECGKKEKNIISIPEVISSTGTGQVPTNALPSLEKQAGHLNSDLSADPQMTTRLRSSLSSSRANFEETKGPPTPHRKTSLDLSFLHRFPLTIKLGAQPTVPPIKLNSRTSDSKVVESTASECKKPLLQQSAKVSPCISEIPPPPPPPTGLPKKLRKQQGSTHPLSKLIRQRHPNPLYNTM